MPVLKLGADMQRRKFIGLFGGAVVTWPLAARAQQPDRARRIGVLYILGPDDPEAKVRHAVFEQTLSQLGWTPGRDLLIDVRFADGDAARLRRYAAELVALVPDAILTVG